MRVRFTEHFSLRCMVNCVVHRKKVEGMCIVLKGKKFKYDLKTFGKDTG